MKKIKIAVQKSGKLYDESINFLNLKGIFFNKLSNREMIAISSCGKYEILFVRHGDIPKYIELGAVDYGIVGENIIYENNYKINILQKLGFGICNLMLAVPKNSLIKQAKDLEGYKIATSYPLSLQNFLNKNNINANILEINGSVEICPKIGVSDAICDMVQTGNSLRENNLVPIAEIYKTEAVLISSRSYIF